MSNATLERALALVDSLRTEILSAMGPTPVTPPPAPPSVVPVMRFGRSKGLPLSQAADADLEWYGRALETSIADPSKARYREDNERQLDAVRVERERRSMQAGAMPGSAAGADDSIPF